VWAPVVVKADPVRDHAAGMLQGVEAVAVHALVFEGSDHALDHAILLRAVRGDEFLLQAVALDRFTLGCPALDVVFHQGAHRRFLQR